jgi:hypothetical protein
LSNEARTPAPIPATKVDLEALRVELREALVNAVDEIVNAVKSVSPPLGMQLRVNRMALEERLLEIERRQESLAVAIEALKASVGRDLSELGDRLAGRNLSDDQRGGS